MNCDEALLAISAALDGELSPAERVRLSEHLVQCDTCRELAEDLRVLTEELERSDREIPQGLAANIRRAVAEEPPAPKRRRAPYLRAVAAMLVLCVGLGGIGLFASGRMGMKADSAGGAAPTLVEAAPEARAYSYSAPPENAEDAGGCGGPTADGDPAQAPMESAQPYPEGDTSVPMPSSAPVPAGLMIEEGNGSSEETNPGSEKNGGGGPSSDSEENAPDSASPPPDAVITFRRLPEGWEELFPGVASIDAMQAPVGEARVFLQLLEEQGITYEIDLSDAAEASGASGLSDLDENSLCQLLLAKSDE